MIKGKLSEKLQNLVNETRPDLEAKHSELSIVKVKCNKLCKRIKVLVDEECNESAKRELIIEREKISENIQVLTKNINALEIKCKNKKNIKEKKKTEQQTKKLIRNAINKRNNKQRKDNETRETKAVEINNPGIPQFESFLEAGIRSMRTRRILLKIIEKIKSVNENIAVKQKGNALIIKRRKFIWTEDDKLKTSGQDGLELLKELIGYDLAQFIKSLGKKLRRQKLRQK